jgi:putative transposase
MLTTLNKGSHSAYCIHLHIGLITKYRRKVITGEMLDEMKIVFERVCHAQKSELIEFDGESDHVHLLVSTAPDTTPSELIRSLKSASSRIIRSKFKDIVDKVYMNNVFWHHSYFVLSVGGAPLETLKKYIQNQETPI